MKDTWSVSRLCGFAGVDRPFSDGRLVRGIASHALAIALLLGTSLQAVAADPVDVVIENATIYDGSGQPGVLGHVAFRDGRIVSVGPDAVPDAAWRLEGTGLIVAPGFIDLHTHSDGQVTDPALRSCVNYLMQGCTTSVTGNCGSGPTDVGTYYDKIDAAGAGTNVAHLLPQGSLRSRVVGTVDQRATAEELTEMRRLTEKAMQEGAWGMSTGLIYVPSVYADTAELIELAKVVSRGQGIYASHIRGEGGELLAAVTEAIRIGREAGLPAHISHLKASGKANWGTLRVAMDLVEQARKSGLHVTADQYPYTASSTSLEATLFPTWARSGGTQQLIQRLDDAATATKIQEYVEQNLEGRDGGEGIFLARCSSRPDWIGKNVSQIAKAEGKSSWEIADYLIRNGGAAVVNFAMSEDDVRIAMQADWVATASDGRAYLPGPDRPHPRNYGTFPRKIGHYALREQVLSLEQAIRSSSGLPAEILGLKERGFLKPGYAADVIVFDPKTFIDVATFEQPHQYSQGLRHVFVNGVLAVYNGQPTGALAGRALRKAKIKE